MTSCLLSLFAKLFGGAVKDEMNILSPGFDLRAVNDPVIWSYLQSANAEKSSRDAEDVETALGIASHKDPVILVFAGGRQN